jgi:hypothetical protein
VRLEHLIHLIRAAGEIADDDLVIVGSQAILASHPDAPAELLFSMEADVYPRGDPAGARAIDAAIGDGSAFHEVYGYYAHGVGPETAIVPGGWEQRLIRLDAPPVTRGQRPRTGWCLEAHDLVLAKIARGDDRDWDFAVAALRARLVRSEELRARADGMPPGIRAAVRLRVEGVIARSRR